MKKIISVISFFNAVILLTFVFFTNSFSQIIYNSKIDSITALVSPQTIIKYAKELSGDTVATIGGSPYLIYSRYNLSPPKLKAGQYIFEKFQSYGLNPRYQLNDTNCINVLAVKTGTKYPNQCFIICGHYDDMRNIIPNPSPEDTIPGADDNASGVCAVLEAARLLSNFNSSYSLVFIVFDKEEVNLGGSRAYVDSIYTKGDTIRGVLDLDGIGFDGNNDNKFNVCTDSNSSILADQMIGVVQAYQIGMPFYKWLGFGASDISAFWQKNYKGILFCEDYNGEGNLNQHHLSDKVNTFNLSFYNKMIKATIGLFATWGGGYFARIDHTPLQSFYDTTGRTVDAYINCPFPIGTGVNAPRLYYKLWDGSYNHVNPYFVYQNNYRFNIPGQPHGSKISYYLAAQDSAGTLVFTFPSGGSGVNPPGTTPPPQMFIYYIWTNKIVSSSTVPKPITGMLTTDTIRVLTSGIVVDVNVTLTLNHSNDGDLILSLKRLSNTSNLSQYNGTGGQNFTNTIFDDSALISISQGNPPLTGRFKPQTPLSALKGLELSGDWVLRIYDRGSGNTGTLLNWSMEIVYAPGVSVRKISEIIPDKFVLSQNYPNPFNPVTKIKYDIPKSGFVKLVIFDALGREVETLVNEKQSAGSYEAVWDALLYTSGVYFYRLTADGYINTKRMILIK